MASIDQSRTHRFYNDTSSSDTETPTLDRATYRNAKAYANALVQHHQYGDDQGCRGARVHQRYTSLRDEPSMDFSAIQQAMIQKLQKAGATDIKIETLPSTEQLACRYTLQDKKLYLVFEPETLPGLAWGIYGSPDSNDANIVFLGDTFPKCSVIQGKSRTVQEEPSWHVTLPSPAPLRATAAAIHASPPPVPRSMPNNDGLVIPPPRVRELALHDLHNQHIATLLTTAQAQEKQHPMVFISAHGRTAHRSWEVPTNYTVSFYAHEKQTLTSSEGTKGFLRRAYSGNLPAQETRRIIDDLSLGGGIYTTLTEATQIMRECEARIMDNERYSTTPAGNKMAVVIVENSTTLRELIAAVQMATPGARHFLVHACRTDTLLPKELRFFGSKSVRRCQGPRRSVDTSFA